MDGDSSVRSGSAIVLLAAVFWGTTGTLQALAPEGPFWALLCFCSIRLLGSPRFEGLRWHWPSDWSERRFPTVCFPWH
ncbi:MAG: hypothetical protein U9Q00_06650 [Synergistota bacterium]|nr:hypothetical protein [Synergistota bacterium]